MVNGELCIHNLFSRGTSELPNTLLLQLSSGSWLPDRLSIPYTLLQGKHSFGQKHLFPHKIKSRCSSGDNSVQKVFSKDAMTLHKLLTPASHSCNPLSVGFTASRSPTCVPKTGNTLFLFHAVKIQTLTG